MNIQQLKNLFCEIYGENAEKIRVFESPGRVNLIGEHTDYNGGYVLPAALTMKTTIIARKRSDKIVKLAVTDLPDRVSLDLANIEDYKTLNWGSYQAGVISEMMKAGYTIDGCDLLYHDTIPHGGGLSSSAAIEVSTALMFAVFSGETAGQAASVDMVEMARIGQMAENNYIGVQCGIMDQFASAMGKKDHVVFLNCRDLSYELVPAKMDGYKIVIANTNKKRSLAMSKYNERRSECEAGLMQLRGLLTDKSCLGEISVEEFEQSKHLITDETVLRRVTHVIYENYRVKASARALKDGNIKAFGEYMVQSHVSLRDLYEVSCTELDTLVDEGLKIDGAAGCRMTGAGFGGCTVNLVREDAVDEFVKTVGERYNRQIGHEASFYISGIGDGSREIIEFY